MDDVVDNRDFSACKGACELPVHEAFLDQVLSVVVTQQDRAVRYRQRA
jgi:hypothetical protein